MSNPQNYNRYSYVLNNPLKYIDPSGELTEAWDHGYTIDDEGNIEYVDATGGDKYDVLYQKEAYDNGNRDYDYNGDGSGIRIDDTDFIPGLMLEQRPYLNSNDNLSFETRYSKGYFSQINSNQATSVFKFLARTNSSATRGGFEWGMLQLNNGSTFIGSVRDNRLSLQWEIMPQFSDVTKYAYDVHSHPNATWDDFTHKGDNSRAASLRAVNPNLIMAVYMPQLTISRYNNVVGKKDRGYLKRHSIPYPLKKVPAGKMWNY